MKVPVLLIGFNRPEIIEQSFNCIKAARPQKLYVAIDGPRKNINGETELVEEVRSIVQNVDWPCEKHFRFNKTNKGAEVTVSSAISWVFEKEEYVIILEDDIIAPLSFFKFAQEILIRYKYDERIGIVSGNNFTPIQLKNDDDYLFVKYGHSWGWGTWRRVWDSFDLDIEVDKTHLKRKFLKTISNSQAEANFYKKRFQTMRKRGTGNNTWDVVANYISRVHNRINIIPRVNLTSNIGVNGLHAKGESVFHKLPIDEKFEVRNHPEMVKIYIEYDKHHFKEHILKHQNNIFQRIINKIQKISIGKKIINL